ncbi:cation:proton antiporter [Arcanobacterium phocae]|uniref:cation:proton antiporter n=1 Tax=Arcanobacterium phocae TaxID=131112 RepID=UPI001C0EC455|nr:sodium:proton antiporter [Arcanobacterium phocae]
MQALELILLLFSVILLSTVLDQLVSGLSLPLIQIAMGLLAALVIGEPFALTIDADLFLVLFIAPLLYDESRKVSKRSLARHMSSILSLAIGLVVASVFAVGFILHWLSPTIPLAAALTLGAALGPTDAVAVTALSKTAKLNERQKALLSGEALINDASGIVSFQFAVALVVTGVFSIREAATAFAISFGGGLVCGLLLGVVVLAVTRAVRSVGLESTVFHVTFEIFTPFAIYLVAESLHVSGVLAVVGAGLLVTLAPLPSTVYTARVSLVSSGVWEVLSFILNGVVFVFLGSNLPSIVTNSWEQSADPLALLGMVIAGTVVVVGVRYLWIVIADFISMKRGGLPGFPSLRSVLIPSLVTTLGGPKGAVTLTIAFTLPYGIIGTHGQSIRDELIFLASGIILFTLLLANFIVPRLAPFQVSAQEKTRENDVRAAVLRLLIKSMTTKFETHYPIALALFVSRYRREIAELTAGDDFATANRQLRLELIFRQREFIDDMLSQNTISVATHHALDHTLERLLQVMKHRRSGAFNIKGMWAFITSRIRIFLDDHSSDKAPDSVEQLRHARIELEKFAIAFLESATIDSENAENVRKFLLREHNDMLRQLEQSSHRQYPAIPETQDASNTAHDPEIPSRTMGEQLNLLEVEALRLELGCIQELREDGQITLKEAQMLRDEIYLLQMNLSDLGTH